MHIKKIWLVGCVLLCAACSGDNEIRPTTVEASTNRAAVATPTTVPTRDPLEAASTREPQMLGEEPSGYVTFWFDDGLQSTYNIAYPALEERGWKAVVAVVGNREVAMEKFVPDGDPVMSWDAVRELASAGWEISSHSMTHPRLDRIKDPAFLEMEIQDSKEALESRGIKTVSFTLPYGEYGGSVGNELVEVNYRYWRSMEYDLNYVPPSRELSAYFLTADVSKDRLTKWISTAERKGGWLIIGLHAILEEPTNRWQHTPEQFEMVLDAVDKSSLDVVLPGEMFERFGYAEGVVPELVESEFNSQTLGIDDISTGGVYLEIPAIGVGSELGVACNEGGGEDLDFSNLHEFPLWICSEASPYLEDVGYSGASLVIGHRQWGPQPKVFARLDELQEGDVVRVAVPALELEFEVVGEEVVDPEGVWSVLAERNANAQEEGNALLVLLTCTPYGTDQRRLLVYAQLRAGR